jgi:hypothetical protein
MNRPDWAASVMKRENRPGPEHGPSVWQRYRRGDSRVHNAQSTRLPDFKYSTSRSLAGQLAVGDWGPPAPLHLFAGQTAVVQSMGCRPSSDQVSLPSTTHVFHPAQFLCSRRAYRAILGSVDLFSR